jgi:hypothetical protein
VLQGSCRKYVNDDDKLGETVYETCVEAHHALWVPPTE